VRKVFYNILTSQNFPAIAGPKRLFVKGSRFSLRVDAGGGAWAHSGGQFLRL